MAPCPGTDLPRPGESRIVPVSPCPATEPMRPDEEGKAEAWRKAHESTEVGRSTNDLGFSLQPPLLQKCSLPLPLQKCSPLQLQKCSGLSADEDFDKLVRSHWDRHLLRMDPELAKTT